MLMKILFVVELKFKFVLASCPLPVSPINQNPHFSQVLFFPGLHR